MGGCVPGLREIPGGGICNRRDVRSAVDRAGRDAALTWNRSSATCRPRNAASAAPTPRLLRQGMAAQAAGGEEPELVMSMAAPRR
jgi:hypothetical protein